MAKKSKKVKSEIEKKFEEFQEAFVNKLVFLTDKYGTDWPQEWFDYELALDEENWEIIVNFSINPPDDYLFGSDIKNLMKLAMVVVANKGGRVTPKILKFVSRFKQGR